MIRVLVLGPDPKQVGGMATVVAQMLDSGEGGGIRYDHFPPTPEGRSGESFSSRIRRHIRHLLRLNRALQEHPADVVHLHTCSGFSFFRSGLDQWVAKRRGARIVLHIHGARFDEFLREARWVTRNVIRFVLQSADRVIALSEHWADVLRRSAPRAAIEVIPNAVEPPDLARRPRQGSPFRFLLLCKMDEWKGVDDLLLACAALVDGGVPFELTLAGPSGSAGDDVSLNRRISELGLADRVVYAGPVVGEQKSELFRWADACVQPSHHEGLPLSVLEAMSHALPVIATRVGALPEVIEDGVQGRLVPPGRPDALAQAMKNLATCRSLCEEMGARARRRIEERFSLDRFRDHLAAMYASALSLEGRCHSKKTPLVGEKERFRLGRVPAPSGKGDALRRVVEPSATTTG